MSEKVDALRRAYMTLGEVCRDLAAMSREAGESPELVATKDTPLEHARQQAARARMDVWKALKEEVLVDWLNETETPDLFNLYPPKDMP